MIDRRTADSSNSGLAEKDRGGQRALVRRREDHRLVDTRVPQYFDEREHPRAVHRRSRCLAPGKADDDHVVNSRKTARGRLAARAAEHRDARTGCGRGAHCRTREHDVAETVGTHHNGMPAHIATIAATYSAAVSISSATRGASTISSGLVAELGTRILRPPAA